MTTISDRRRKLELIIETAHSALADLREQCTHSGELTYKYAGGGDGWSRNNDDYWMDWHCLDCGKRWATSQENAYELTTKTYPNAVKIR